MQFLISFTQSDDVVLFDSINPALVEWFIESSKQNGNTYSLGDQEIDKLNRSNDTDLLIQQEIDYINKVNSILKISKMPQLAMPDNWHNQQQLNRLHKDWANTRIKWPKLTELIYKKFGKDSFTAYQEMNCHIHLIENSYKYVFRDSTNWRLDNPFKNQFFNWHECNIYIKYPGHGREAFEQFTNLDIGKDMFDGMVNWDNIDALIGVNLKRPYEQSVPVEFSIWCKNHNIVAHRGTLPLGNLTDWENNLTKARQVFNKNVKIPGNCFKLDML